MKNLVLKILCAALFCVNLTFVSCNTKRPSIYGNLAGMPDQMVYLSLYEDGAVRNIDSTLSRVGQFKFRQQAILPDILQIQFKDYPDFYLPVVMDGSDVYIDGNFNYRDDIIVSGTESNEAFGEYRKSMREYAIVRRAVEMGLEGYRDTLKLMDTVRYEALRGKVDSISTLIEYTKRSFIHNHPASIVSAMLVSGMVAELDSPQEVRSLVECLDSTMVDNVFLRQIHRRTERVSN